MSTVAAIQYLVPLIDAFKADTQLELEGSLGVLTQDCFVSGVDFVYFKTIHKVFSEAAAAWSEPEDKSHFASFYYALDVRARYNVKDKPVIVCKTPLGKCDIVCAERAYDMRVNLKREQPSVTTVTDVATFVRLHERWSFTYKNAWRYDFSKVASGATKELACSAAPVFEIELELLRNVPFLNSISSEHLAQHMLEKLTDLLGRFDTNHCTLPLTLQLVTKWN
jgi:hypothetical protein